MENNRRIGNTTRLVDYYIQHLFNNPGDEIKIVDHYDVKPAHRYLLDRIINRLQLEHKSRVFIVDYDKNTLLLPQGEKGYISYWIRNKSVNVWQKNTNES